MFSVLMSAWILSAVNVGHAQCPFPLTASDVASLTGFKVSSSELDGIVDNFIKETTQNAVSQYAVAVVYQNQTVYTSGLSTTPFRCASITKTFTALGALMQRDRGLLSLDDPVKKFLPGYSVISPYGEHNTTVRELMGHVSGLPMQLCPFLLTCTDNETEILQQIAGMELARPPWSSQPIYSNLGIALLGHTWEKATSPQVTWWDFLRDNVITPLRMTSTGTDSTNIVMATNADPYARQDLGWSAPAAQMYSTAEDLAKYLGFVMTGSPALISDASRREWFRPSKLFSDGKSGYAMPWELYKLASNVSTDFIVSKAGNINGYQSHMAFHKEYQLGVVVLTVYTQLGLPGPDALANAILTALIPELESTNNQTIANLYDGVYQCARSPGFASPTLNYTVAVLGGTITVTSNDSLGLSATLNVNLQRTGGQPYVAGEVVGLQLKNATENSFWFGASALCLSYFFSLSGAPDLTNPNTPGSLYTNELRFDSTTSSLLWPTVGANCTRS